MVAGLQYWSAVCEVWLPSLFWPSFMGRGPPNPFTPSPTPGCIRLHTSLKYHMQLAMPQWKHQIISTRHIYMSIEVKAILTLSIYICIMCWQTKWTKNGKAVKGLSEGTLWTFLYFTKSCQKCCYLTPWLLYAYIYMRNLVKLSAHNVNSPSSSGHVFSKTWAIVAVSGRRFTVLISCVWGLVAIFVLT